MDDLSHAMVLVGAVSLAENNGRRDHWRVRGYSCGTGPDWVVHYEHLSTGESTSRQVSAEEFRGLPAVVAELPGVPFVRASRAASTAT